MEAAAILSCLGMFLASLGLLYFAIRKVEVISLRALDIMSAKSLREVAEVEHIRDVNKANYLALIETYQRGDKEPQLKDTAQNGPLNPAKKYVTDVDGQVYLIEDLEVL
jgi:hypothetical protein